MDMMAAAYNHFQVSVAQQKPLQPSEVTFWTHMLFGLLHANFEALMSRILSFIS